MSERIEMIIREYPQMKTELRCLEHQIKNFKGISETEMIESMNFSSPEGERVQTSNISNKPASIALNYHARMEEINREWYEHLEKRYLMLSEDVRFFEAALTALSGYLPDFMTDMVVHGCTWDYLCEHYHISRTMVAKNRRKAIVELDELYRKYDDEMVSYMLS
nr:MAG TPA: Sigma-70, region 4 [Caudoviricetes sp.]